MTAQLLTLAVSILFTWLAWWLVFAGWGVLFARACGRRVRSAPDLIHAFWSGWALVLVFLMFWHFCRRIDGLTAAVVAAIGLAGLLSSARRLAPLALRWTRSRIIFALLFTLLAAFVSNHTLMPPVNFDTGLYHLPQVRWIHTYRIVPGLGNLHGRLAFNQSYFLYVSMIDTGPWRGLAWHWASGPLLLTLVAQLALKLLSSLRPGEPPTRRIFWWLLAVPVLDHLNNYNISSPTPDIPVFVLSIVLALDVMDLLFLPPAAVRDLRWRVLRIVLVGLTGITIKFNFIFLGAGSAALALGLAMARMRNAECGMRNEEILLGARASSPANPSCNQSALSSINDSGNSQLATGNCAIPHSAFRIPHLSSAFLLALFILAPYVARDVILSGWIAYPMPLLPMPVPWRLPPQAVDAEIAQITGFARDPFESQPFPIHGWGWIRDWSTHMAEFQQFEFMLPLALATVCLLLALIQRRQGIPKTNARPMWLFLAVPCSSLAFWAATAPHPRFAGGAFWIAAAGALAFLLTRFGPQRRRLIYGLTAAIVALSAGMANPVIPLKMPGPDRGFYPVPRVTDAFEYKTDHGLVIHARPKGQFQTWDMPLPNTPYVKSKLRLRRAGDLGSGFIIDGPLTEKTS